MAELDIHAALSAYLAIYLAVAFGWRTYHVYRTTGRNPYVLASGDDAEGYVARAFRATLIASLIAVVAPAVAPDLARFTAPFEGLSAATRLPGIALLALSLLTVAVAQAQMGTSWRIGIDKDTPTELVRHGLFAWSRNPIFLSMRATLLGLFGVIPSGLTLAVFVAGEILMQVQVRLEETYLSALHGAAYDEYRSRVARWLGRGRCV